MTRRLEPTPDQLDYLRTAVATQVPYRDLAAYMGCCTDTLRRILVRHKLAFFGSEKYLVCDRDEPAMWTRPCIRCRATTKRPRTQYICDDCTSDTDRSDADWVYI